MLFTTTTFIGLDPGAGRQKVTYAALDNDLRPLALGTENLSDVLAFVAGQGQAFVGVSAPRQPNQGLMKDLNVRAGLQPQPRPGRWGGYRVAEYMLTQAGVRTTRTPANPENCRGWQRTGFTLWQRLFSMGYTLYPATDSGKQVLEVYPQACFCRWLGAPPFNKRTLEGRIQRQLALYDLELDIPDPMRVFEEFTRHRLRQGILPLEGLYTHNELDALTGAATAWLAVAQPEAVELMGHPNEGEVVLPLTPSQPR